jgi:hypothetical protein
MKKINQKGQILIVVTVFFALLGVFVGIAVDFARAFLERARLSRNVDAAALAAAKTLKGQVAFEDAAVKAGCGAVSMNGVTSSRCGRTAPANGGNPPGCSQTTTGPDVAICFVSRAVSGGGPPMQFVQVTGRTTVPTTFLRLLSLLSPGNFSTLNVRISAEAGPERPVDLMLVLDRSGSMNEFDPTGTRKITALINTVNQFLSPESGTFQADDRVGMVSFASRGCGLDGVDVTDSVGDSCNPDVPLGPAADTVPRIRTLVSGLVANGFTNTQETFRSTRVQMERAFSLPDRARSRKVVLFITDGQPTDMRRDNTVECTNFPTNPYLRGSLPPPGDTWDFPEGCTFFSIGGGLNRKRLNGAFFDEIPGLLVFQALADGYRNMDGGAMFEANIVRNLKLLSSPPDAQGQVVVYAIGIGQDLPSISPKLRLDNNSKCFLARVANSSTVSDPTVREDQRNMAYFCGNSGLAGQGDQADPYADLQRNFPPCPGGERFCIDSKQMEGKVWVVDQAATDCNVECQLRKIFGDVAALLRLRLTA